MANREDEQGLGSLLEGWEWKSMSEVVRASKRRIDPKSSKTLPYIGLEHIVPDMGVLSGHGSTDDVRSTKSLFDEGDLLYGKLRPYLNKVVIAPFDGVSSTDILVFPKSDEVDNRFLKYRMLAYDFVRYSQQNVSGVQHPRVNEKSIGGFELALPLLPEQQAIVAKVEELFTQLDAGVAALKRARTNLKRYKASVLKAACEGRLVPTEAELARAEGRDYEPASELLARILKERRAKWEADLRANGKDLAKAKYKEPAAPDTANLPELPEGWCWATVEQLAAHEPYSFTDGPFGSKLKTEHYRHRGPRVIRLQNIGDGEFIDEKAHISSDHFEALRRHQVFPGDLVIRALGDDVPRACVIPDNMGQAIVKADCMRLKTHERIFNNRYALLALNSEPVRKFASHIIHGIGRPRLNQDEVKSLPIPLPPFQEQLRIVELAEKTLSIVKVQLESIEFGIARSNRLRQAILKRAFEGKLIPRKSMDGSTSAFPEQR